MRTARLRALLIPDYLVHELEQLLSKDALLELSRGWLCPPGPFPRGASSAAGVDRYEPRLPILSFMQVSAIFVE